MLTFVSIPDWLNGDLGDVRRLPGHDPGDPNSWNPKYAASIRLVTSEIAAKEPDAVLVAGDLVGGHWGLDTKRTGIFGPVDTRAHQAVALRRAGDFYYGRWRSFLADAGLPNRLVYPALGDHDIGDNNWWPGTFKHAAVPRFRDVFVDNLLRRHDGTRRFSEHPDAGSQWDGTAYATWLSPQLLLISVDVFRRTPDGVQVTVAGTQLAWLRGLLAGVPAETTVIVQGHAPVLGPVRTRGSSNLEVRGGADSRFWQTLREYGVDFYLCGEVHANTAIQRGVGEPIQISHGGLMAWGSVNYLVGRVHANGRLELDLRQLKAITVVKEPRLWQTNRPIARSVVLAPSTSVGAMTVRDRVIESRTGQLAPYEPSGRGSRHRW